METLNGISSIAYWATLNFHLKPLGLLNVNIFYDCLLLFLGHIGEQGFISKVAWHSIMYTLTADQLIDQIQIYAPKPDPSVKQIDWQSPDNNER